MLSVEQKLPRALHDLIHEMKQIYTMEIVHAKCKPRFGHEFTLSQLKAMGFKLGLASNSIRSTVEVMLKKACLWDYLDVVLSNEDVMHAKPHPEIYTRAIQHLGYLPQECLVIEDNIIGIKAAHTAGANVLHVHNVEDVNMENIFRYLDKLMDITNPTFNFDDLDLDTPSFREK